MSLKIHIVEDSAHVQSYLKRAIGAIPGAEIEGYSEESTLAIRMIQREKPGLVLLDLSLREGHGIDVLRAIKRIMPPPVVLVLTNHATEFYRSRSLTFGADYFFDKSLEYDQAIETIRSIVEKKREIRETEPHAG